MKTVYADVVFAVNFAADYVLLYISAYSLHIKVRTIRLLAASIIGGIYGVAASIVPVASSFLLLISFAVLLLMCSVAFAGVTSKAFIYLVINMCVYSFILCGMVSLEPLRKRAGITVLVFGCVLIVFAVKRLRLYRINQKSRRHISAVICTDGCERELELLCDSGNLLTDPVTFSPIIILSNSFANSLSSEKTRFVTYRTVGGEGTLDIAEDSEIYILKDNKRIRVFAVVGFCKESETFSGYDGIIPELITQNI